ncbi:hypothetical protein [Reyranella sp.]|uniref:hypothetical protein n=1 Tax=Reyranella sp. TaxID=1929291 RepID=UPI003BA875C8
MQKQDRKVITLHSVSKEVGRGRFKRQIIEDLNWTIRPRSRTFVLGQRTAVSQLLSVIAGHSVPSEGWVSRRGKISPPQGFLRFGKAGTPRQLIARLCEIYGVEPKSVENFIEAALEHRHVLDSPVRQLPASLKRELNVALTYAIPCDYYLFFGGIGTSPRLAFRTLCEKALNQRAKVAGIVVGTHSSRVAQTLKGFSSGAILYKGKFTLFKYPEDAIAVYDSLEPEDDIPTELLKEDREEAEDTLEV